jgi:hypothetical protein
MAIGTLTALAVRTVIRPGMDMVVAMLRGTAVGMMVHLVVGSCCPRFWHVSHDDPSVVDWNVRRYVFRHARLDGGWLGELERWRLWLGPFSAQWSYWR